MSNGAVQGRPSTGRRFAPHSCPAGLEAAAQLRGSVSAGAGAHRGCGTQGLACRGWHEGCCSGTEEPPTI